MNNQNIILYSGCDGAIKVEVVVKDETVWLTQMALAKLFGVKVPAVNKHLKNIFTSNELSENSVISILETTAADGKVYKTKYYSLDAIIAVGYRVNSYQVPQFRKKQDAEYISDFDRAVKRLETNKMTSGFTENDITRPALGWFESLKYSCPFGPHLTPGDESGANPQEAQ